MVSFFSLQRAKGSIGENMDMMNPQQKNASIFSPSFYVLLVITDRSQKIFSNLPLRGGKKEKNLQNK